MRKEEPFYHHLRVAIVGAGHVGSTFAYSLLLSGLASEIVLIDADFGRAEGEAMDLNHAVPFSPPARIWAGDYADCADADVVVIAAGVNQKPGESRLDLLSRNTEIFRQIIPSVCVPGFKGVLLIASNPVDVLTYVALECSGLPSNRVIGSGTILDTARFRYLISRHFKVDPHNVHAYIIGEHGDSEVPVWSSANIAGLQLHDYCISQGVICDSAQLDEIFRQTRTAAAEIIRRKGATYYAIASSLMRIVEAILRDEHSVLSVSNLIEDYEGH